MNKALKQLSSELVGEMRAKTETPAPYLVSARKNEDDNVIARALQIVAERAKMGDALTSPLVVKQWLALRMAGLGHEEFYCLWLTTQNTVIELESMFRGTLSQTSVYPREVVKRALAVNAGAVIFAHNHPSGLAEPSYADEALTRALKQALALVDVKVLDHFVVAGAATTSFAERGIL